METGGGGGGGVSAWGTCARNDSFSTSLWWPSLQIQLSVLADRDAYPAARSMEGGQYLVNSVDNNLRAKRFRSR